MKFDVLAIVSGRSRSSLCTHTFNVERRRLIFEYCTMSHTNAHTTYKHRMPCTAKTCVFKWARVRERPTQLYAHTHLVLCVSHTSSLSDDVVRFFFLYFGLFTNVMSSTAHRATFFYLAAKSTSYNSPKQLHNTSSKYSNPSTNINLASLKVHQSDT